MGDTLITNQRWLCSFKATSIKEAIEFSASFFSRFFIPCHVKDTLLLSEQRKYISFYERDLICCESCKSCILVDAIFSFVKAHAQKGNSLWQLHPQSVATCWTRGGALWQMQRCRPRQTVLVLAASRRETWPGWSDWEWSLQ